MEKLWSLVIFKIKSPEHRDFEIKVTLDENQTKIEWLSKSFWESFY